ncbi:hypothetical protein PAPYRUS_55 [Mycobacterium phage Papyrus]|uniref:Uncharacterized protein n=1 Tax=Mycobacterium phage Papyrus TaxID=1383056 RepID=S5YE29_9CAUD|nr:hypothetical protein N842_gp055 [Mycobacterium phage Papyrus]AGT14065.1 hypothetical protein PAPYRUS_55 [Mycobacterium phage Papyrus]
MAYYKKGDGMKHVIAISGNDLAYLRKAALSAFQEAGQIGVLRIYITDDGKLMFGARGHVTKVIGRPIKASDEEREMGLNAPSGNPYANIDDDEDAQDAAEAVGHSLEERVAHLEELIKGVVVINNLSKS